MRFTEHERRGEDDTHTADDAVKEIKSREEGSGGTGDHPRLIRFYRSAALECRSALWSWNAWRCSLVSIRGGLEVTELTHTGSAIVVRCGHEAESMPG